MCLNLAALNGNWNASLKKFAVKRDSDSTVLELGRGFGKMFPRRMIRKKRCRRLKGCLVEEQAGKNL